MKTTSTWPRRAASCKGVHPAWSLTFAERPEASSWASCIVSFRIAARCRTLSPLLLSRSFCCCWCCWGSSLGFGTSGLSSRTLSALLTTFCLRMTRFFSESSDVVVAALPVCRMVRVCFLETGEERTGLLSTLTTIEFSVRHDFSGVARGAIAYCFTWRKNAFNYKDDCNVAHVGFWWY